MIARNRKSGFTLVEILIVVVILGILAAIVIPQFSSASESARASSLKSTLQTVRSQLELFQVQHNGQYPYAMANGAAGELPTWLPMTDEHSLAAAANLTDGLQAADLDFTGEDLGPYMQKFPANPFANGSNLAASHWYYEPTTGQIAANIAGVDADKLEALGLDDEDDFATEAPDWLE